VSDCYLCGETNDLRQYGPRGEMVCFQCAMKPENKAKTESMFVLQLNAAGPVAVIDGTNVGPYPYRKEPAQ